MSQREEIFTKMAERAAPLFGKKPEEITEDMRFDALGAKSGVPITMNYNPMDVVGVKAPDALRMLRGGLFHALNAG